MISDLWETAKHVMFSPKSFFKKVKGFKGIKHAFIYITILVLIIFVFMTYYYVEQINSILSQTAYALGIEDSFKISLDFQTYILLYFAFCILFLLLVFLRSWLTHIFVRLLGGRNTYDQTYNAWTYSSTPDYISAPLMAIMVAIQIFIDDSALRWSLLILLWIILLALIIYQMYLTTIGLASLQKISKLRAFVCIYVLGTGSYFILVMIAAAVLGLGFGLIAASLGLN